MIRTPTMLKIPLVRKMISKKLNTSLAAIRTLKPPESPGADLASRPGLRAASMSDSLFTPASPPPPNQGVGQPAAAARAALEAAFQLLAPRPAHGLSAEAFGLVRVVCNRALHFHHLCLRRTGCPPTFSLRAADDNRSRPTVFHRVRRYSAASDRKSQHALPNALHFLCGNCLYALARLITWIRFHFGPQAGPEALHRH